MAFSVVSMFSFGSRVVTTNSLELGWAGSESGTQTSWFPSRANPLSKLAADFTIFNHSSFFLGSDSESFLLLPLRDRTLFVFFPSSPGVAATGVVGTSKSWNFCWYSIAASANSRTATK